MKKYFENKKFSFNLHISNIISFEIKSIRLILSFYEF